MPLTSTYQLYFTDLNINISGIKVLHCFNFDKSDLLLVYFDYLTNSLCLLLVNENGHINQRKKRYKSIWQSKKTVASLKILDTASLLSFLINYDEKTEELIKFTFDELFTIANTIKNQCSIKLKRVDHNPILTATSENTWENRYVFNPAALYLAGKVHLLYRATGDTGVSVFGYASSSDGLKIDERLAEPAFSHNEALFEAKNKNQTENKEKKKFNYISGPTFVGAEDPRLVHIGDRIYMTYTSFGDWYTPPGVAITSISTSDFLNKRWHWSPPQMMSPPNEMHKNWVLFPQKINGQYAILHSITPSLKIDYLDSLKFSENKFIKSYHSPIEHRDTWDNWVRGAGAPPIKTDQGWLLLYHAMDRRDPNRYKLGVMLLDITDPSIIKARLPYPLLEPNAWYENRGFKSGVIYNCGAVVMNDQLFVYYGGADTVVCAATIKLPDLLEALIA